ncbi:hypothetical protein J8F10_23970 [Gemmata sp. G18]|uniref:Uncharacterized protein n=1 Tax=Gemmata palustris TaxID=2822762 RepID=A0ABS5BY33_9BACT|nr:hypothetical protein [Gemmata palustris]MBP3958317.1 hypothetical protein [Gemmata palustris]
MQRHLFLPKQSLKDVRALLRLDEGQIQALDELLGTGESVSLGRPNFAQKVAERLRLEQEAASSVTLVGQFLLTVVEEGHPPDEIIDDMRQFLEQYPEEKGALSSLDAKRKALVAMLTQKPERARALKVRYLQTVSPLAESFRSVCELRPVFKRNESGAEEEIVGYVPTVQLRVTECDTDGNETLNTFNMSPSALKLLAEVIGRTEKKLTAIRQRFGNELLGDVAQGDQS